MNTHSPITLQSTPVLAWEALSHPVFERTKRWYTIAGVVVFIAAAYGILTGSWAFAVVSVLSGGMYVLIRDHKPTPIRIEIHDSGVLLNGVFTRWDQLAGYWIVQTPGYTELRFAQKRPRMRMVIQTAGQDPSDLRMILGQRLPELTQMKESLVDICIRLCKL